MNMDRNTVIGFVLLALLLFVYLFISTKNSRELEAKKQHYTDSVARVQKHIQDSLAKYDTVAVDTAAVAGQLATRGAEQLTVVENEVVKVSFSNKGGQPKQVELKNYKSLINGRPVLLNHASFDKWSYSINAGNNTTAQVADIYFMAPKVVRNADNSQTVIYQAPVPGRGNITHQFTIRPNDYLIDWDVQLTGADQMLTQGAFNLIWQQQPSQQETDVKYERTQTTVGFYEDNDFDYIQTKSAKTFEKPVQWVSVAQQFFNTSIIAKNKFTSGEVKFVKNLEDTTAKIAEVTTTLQTRLPLGPNATLPMQLYFGPNDYGILRKHKNEIPEMDKIVNLGRDMYAFVRPINKYIVMPVFDFFKGFGVSLGIAIALLTLFIRLLTSPLVYTSYLSGAKMKALRPEIEKLKEKYNNDQQQVGVEQMKLFREAGVNPLGGCIPALLQIPIFFALYSFFNSNIDLRGVDFLWADNLAAYDAIVRWNFNIIGLGNHLSLFTITAVLTSFLISIYNMNMTPDQNNPALKYMPYIFPFILLFVFNGLPAALTWYYTVSNVITLILQFVIQNYIIDHDKILAKIEENRKKPKTKSKWQERLEQMQEAQQQAQKARSQQKK
ncbi:membrane protein insertase YidC [Longitalea luteola]|uniref:membrane protein insertase YidC n=1 Tax=Longitalea luteola TaxID=2812563 RepID=UPI001A97770A|nr:membrane protein insertase YidC [Longitalea luteola]